MIDYIEIRNAANNEPFAYYYVKQCLALFYFLTFIEKKVVKKERPNKSTNQKIGMEETIIIWKQSSINTADTTEPRLTEDQKNDYGQRTSCIQSPWTWNPQCNSLYVQHSSIKKNPKAH